MSLILWGDPKYRCSFRILNRIENWRPAVSCYMLSSSSSLSMSFNRRSPEEFQWKISPVKISSHLCVLSFAWEIAHDSTTNIVSWSINKHISPSWIQRKSAPWSLVVYVAWKHKMLHDLKLHDLVGRHQEIYSKKERIQFCNWLRPRAVHVLRTCFLRHEIINII